MNSIRIAIVILCLAIVSRSESVGQEDPIQAEILKAKDGYVDGLKDAKTRFLSRFEQRLKEATGKGNLEAVKQITAEKKEFEEDDSLPKSQWMRPDISEYFKDVNSVTRKMEVVLEGAVKTYTKAMQLQKAEGVLAEWDAILEENKRGDIRLGALVPVGGCKVQPISGAIALTEDANSDTAHVMTKKKYRPPFLVRVVAKTNLKSLRLQYAKGEVIFNWEVRPTEFRIRDPADATDSGYPGRGGIRTNQFQEILWEVLPGVMRIYLNGNLVAEKSGQYLGLSSEVGVGPAFRGVVTVSQFAVMPLKNDK